MPRYVVLEHDHPHVHWDLMLEAGAVLRTWRLTAPPSPGEMIPAEAIGDHRLAYLDYEGPVSGGRGRVVRWDAGTFEWLQDANGTVTVRLHGGRLHGVGRLNRQEDGRWTFTLGS